MPTKTQVEEKVKIFEKQNGSIDNFSVKEIIVMLHKETQEKIRQSDEKIDDVSKKIEEQMKWANKTLAEGYAALAERDKIIIKIFEVLPEKGFCEKVTSCLELDKEVTMKDKVELLWNDRRWIKAILAVLIGTAGATILNLLITVLK
jgi:hypothetical protein